MNHLIFEVGGKLPYVHRAKALDYLSWKIMKALEAGITLPQSVDSLNLRWGASDRSGDPFYYEAVFSPIGRFGGERVNPSFELSRASLILAASKIEPFEIISLSTVNPLKIEAKPLGAVAVIGALALLATQYNAHKSDENGKHMREACDRIADRYSKVLNGEIHTPKSKYKELGEAFGKCLNSPVFTAAPLSVKVPEEGE